MSLKATRDYQGMSMLKRKPQTIDIGDRFVAAGEREGRVWEVVYLWTAVDGIQHARLANVGRPSDLRTISVPVLFDPHFWRPAPTRS